MFRKILLSSAISTALALTACSDNNTASTQEAERHLKTSFSYLKQGQLRAAMLESQNAIQLTPNSTDGFLALAKIYQSIGASDSAINLLKQFKGDSPAIKLALAQSYIDSNRPLSAQKTLASITAQGENPTTYYSLLAQAEAGLENKAGFEKALDQLSKTDPQLADLIKAQNLLNTGFAKEALAISEQLHKTTPNSLENLILQGEASLVINNLNLAEESFTKALSLLPNTDVLTVKKAQVLTLLSDTLIQKGRTSEAYVYQKLLAEANPEGHAAQQAFNQALQQYQSGMLDEAKSTLQGLLQTHPEQRLSNMLLALIHYQQGNPLEAASLFDRAIDPETSSATTIKAAALAKLKTQNTEDAIELLQQAIKSKPNNAALQAAYGLALLDQNITDSEGAKALEKSLALDPSQSRLRVLLARHYQAQQSDVLALGQLKQAQEQSPSDKSILKAYIYALANNKDWNTIQSLSSSLQSSEEFALLGHLAEGWQYLYQEEPKSALNSFTSAQTISPKNLEVLSGFANSYEHLKSWQKASSIWLEILNLDPTSSVAYQKYLESIHKTEKPEIAFEALNELTFKATNNWQPAFALSQLYLQKGDLNNAMTFAKKAFEQEPNHRTTRSHFANTHFQMSQALFSENPAKAKSHAVQASKLYPSNLSYLSALIKLEAATGNYAQATSLANQIPDENNGNAVKHYLLGSIYQQQGQFEEASKELQAAWSLAPNDATANALYSNFRKSQQHQQADAFLEQWHQTIPNSYRPTLLIALQKDQAGDKTSAETWYLKALSQQDNIVANNNLAVIYMDKDINNALKYSLEAVNLAPNSADVLDTRAQVLAKANKVSEAISMYERALSLDPNNTEIKARLDKIKQ